jgi:hypothetical protein
VQQGCNDDRAFVIPCFKNKLNKASLIETCPSFASKELKTWQLEPPKLYPYQPEKEQNMADQGASGYDKVVKSKLKLKGVEDKKKKRKKTEDAEPGRHSCLAPPRFEILVFTPLNLEQGSRLELDMRLVKPRS